MRKNYLFNYFSLRSAVKRYEEKYQQAAREFIDQHNATSHERWGLHGTYPRSILVWDSENQCWIKFAVKIVRIRCKATGKTFSYQGGFFIARTRYFCADILTFLSASFLREDKRRSFEKLCGDFQVIISLAKRIKSLFYTIIPQGIAIWAVNSMSDPSLLANWVIDTFWHNACNPFCSSMEANGLA